MAVIIQCQCGQKLKANESQIGKTFACPKCGASNTVDPTSMPIEFAPTIEPPQQPREPPRLPKMPQSPTGLRACRECGHQVARSAKTCPSCGAKDPWISNREQIIAGVVVLVAFGFMVTWCSGAFTPSKPSSANNKDWSADRAKQAERLKLIRDLEQQGIFRQVDLRDRGATVVVGAEFSRLAFEQKKAFTNVVWSYISTEAESEFLTVTLRDVATNKKLGEHTQLGLVID